MAGFYDSSVVAAARKANRRYSQREADSISDFSDYGRTQIYNSPEDKAAFTHAVVNTDRADGVRKLRDLLPGATKRLLEQIQENVEKGVGVKPLNSYKKGTAYVPKTGIYKLHRGEAVIPVKKRKNVKLAALL